MPGGALVGVKRERRSGRDRMLRRALELFARKGYRQTSLRDILLATSMTKGAFYHHWRSKEALAIEVIARAHDRYSGMRRGMLAESGSRPATLAFLEWIRAIHHSPEGIWGRFFISMLSHLSPEDRRLAAKLREVLHLWREGWVEMVHHDRRRGMFALPVDPRVLATLLQGAVIGHLVLEGNLGEGDPFRSAIGILQPLLKKSSLKKAVRA